MADAHVVAHAAQLAPAPDPARFVPACHLGYHFASRAGPVRRRSVGPHEIMRSPHVATLLLLLAACVQRVEAPSRPPAVADHASELAAGRPPLESLRPPTKPEDWMDGCFDLVFAGVGTRGCPSRLQITAKPKTLSPSDRRTVYRVESLDPANPELPLWLWVPEPTSHMRVELTTGYGGWELELHRNGSELAGTARPLSDVPPLRGEPVAAQLHRVDCQAVRPN